MRTSTTSHLHVREQPGQIRLKLAAILLLAIPTGVLLLFAFGEMAAGEISGAQHLPEAAILLALMAGAWRHPRVVGIALVSIGSLLFSGWLILVLAEGEPEPRGTGILLWVAAGVVLFVVPVVAGWLLLRASHHDAG